MSFHSPETRRMTRRWWLRPAGAVAAVAASAPLLARAGCPCAEDQVADGAGATKGANDARSVLRLCADPNNLPYSNRNREGFEDKIAALVAADLGMTLEYEWLPQRLGFYRTALKTFDAQ